MAEAELLHLRLPTALGVLSPLHQQVTVRWNGAQQITEMAYGRVACRAGTVPHSLAQSSVLAGVPHAKADISLQASGKLPCGQLACLRVHPVTARREHLSAFSTPPTFHQVRTSLLP